MPHRGASPTPSEGEIDILGSLYPGDDAEQNVPANQDVDFDNLINGPTGDDSDGDEAFIALQQAASYRKASNLKGKTVKKGGGFQAMGASSNCRNPTSSLSLTISFPQALTRTFLKPLHERDSRFRPPSSEKRSLLFSTGEMWSAWLEQVPERRRHS
jgi:hypothetical protein